MSDMQLVADFCCATLPCNKSLTATKCTPIMALTDTDDYVSIYEILLTRAIYEKKAKMRKISA